MGSQAEVQVIDRDSGATLPVYRHQGEYWVAGRPGARYAVQVKNMELSFGVNNLFDRDFYTQAFGATERFRLVEPSGRIGHAELSIGGGVLYLADDDLPILAEINNNLGIFEHNPGVGVIFAPWIIHDLPTRQDLTIFYNQNDDYLIEQNDQAMKNVVDSAGRLKTVSGELAQAIARFKL